MPKQSEPAEDGDNRSKAFRCRVLATETEDGMNKEDLGFDNCGFTILTSYRQTSLAARFSMATSLWSSPKLRLLFALVKASSHISYSSVKRGSGFRGKKPVSASMSKWTCERCSAVILRRFVLTVEVNNEKASFKNNLHRCGGEGRRLKTSMLSKLVARIFSRCVSGLTTDE